MAGQKRKYSPPQIVDLSGSTTLGQTQGFCLDGTAPTQYTCTPGTQPPGDPASCDPLGSSPTIGGCTGPGNVAVEGCFAGSLFVEP